MRKIIVAVALASAALTGCGASAAAPPSPTIGNSYLPAAPSRVPATAYTYTPPLAPPTPPPAPPQVFEGSGDDVLDVVTSSWDVSILSFECPNCRGNTTVKTNGSEGLLVNNIGAYKGQHMINVRSSSVTNQVEIGATGNWKLTITQGFGAAAVVSDNGAPVSGKGDAVVVLRGNTRRADITYRGDSNFAVWVHSTDSGSDLAVNEIGSYDGKVILDAPAAVQVNSQGDWTITPS